MGRKKKNTNFHPDSVGDYPIGYGKEPHHTKVKKGIASPNPAGRPVGSKKTGRLLIVLLQSFEKKGSHMIEVNVRGKRKKMATDRAIVRQIFNGALAGSSRSQKLAMELSLKEENARRQARNKRFDAAVDYKKCWAEDSKLRRQRGEPDPKVYFHPDDFELNFATGEVTYVGATRDQKENSLPRCWIIALRVPELVWAP